MKHRSVTISCLTTGVILLLTIIMNAAIGLSVINDKNKLRMKLKKPAKIDQVWVAYNNWRYTMLNDGRYMYNDEQGAAGGEFPRGTGLTVVFSAGFWVGTLKDGIPVVSGAEPSGGGTEYQPGRISNPGHVFKDLKAENPMSASQKVYLIDRSLSGPDYANWPDDAPRNNLGLPGLIADGQTWTVLNDLDTTKNLDGSSQSPNQGLGIEVNIESFAINAGTLSDVVYMKYTIKNQTTGDYPNTYIGIYMDADVYKNGAKDVIGCDTVKGLAYTYNALGSNAPYGAVGIDFLQGPVADSGEIDTWNRQAILAKYANNTTQLKWNPVYGRYEKTSLPAGKFWLGAVSLIGYAGGAEAQNDMERYNLMKGLTKDAGPHPCDNGSNHVYAYPGNPLTSLYGDPYVDWSMGKDWRLIPCSGPFTLQAGQSQEIWVGIVGAQGNDRLDAVRNMFVTDSVAQLYFTNSFSGSVPPEVPKISVTGLDNQVVITWQNNSEFSEDLLGENMGITAGNGYTASYIKRDFQGYRVYKSHTGLPGSFTLLAQYDKIDSFGVVQNRTINTDGHLQITDIDLGANTGLQYSYVDTHVQNGQMYYYSVTAYDAQPYIAGPDVYDLNEDKTFVKAWATAVRLANKTLPAFEDYATIYSDSLAFITASIPKLSNYPLVYRNRNNDDNLLGDTLYAVLDTNYIPGNPPDTVRCAFVCNSRMTNIKTYDLDQIKQYLPNPVPQVGDEFLYSDALHYNTGVETYTTTYHFTVISTETFPSYIPKPSGLPISLETSPLQNMAAVVPMKAASAVSYDARTTTNLAIKKQSAGDGVIELETIEPDKVKDKTYFVDFFTIPDTVNKGTSYQKVLRGGIAGQLAYRVIDSASNAAVPFSSRTDDPLTFFDADGDYIYTAGTDSVYDDSYFCTSMGENYGSDVNNKFFPIVEGVKLKVYAPPRDYKNFYWSRNGSGPITANAGFDVTTLPGAGYGVTGDYYRDVLLSSTKSVLNTSVVQMAGGGKFFILCRDNILTYADACSTTSGDALRWNRNPSYWDRLIPNNFYFKWKAAATDTAWIQFGDTAPGIMRIPVEGWMDPATPADTNDDVKLLPFISDHDGDGVFSFSGAHQLIPGSLMGDWFYWVLPQDQTAGDVGYRIFVNDCAAYNGAAHYVTINGLPYGEIMARQVITNYNGAVNRPLETGNAKYWPDAGSVFNFEMTKPNKAGDRYVYYTRANTKNSKSAMKDALKHIKVVPNPYYANSKYEAGLNERVIKFFNLPERCTIRIFTVAGDLVRTIYHNDQSRNDRNVMNTTDTTGYAPAKFTSVERWDLRTVHGKHVGSGMYIAHIDAPGIGSTTLKFAVIR